MLQCKCPNLIPGLRAQPFWNVEEFPWIQHLQNSFEDIRNEFLALRGTDSFQVDCYRDIS